MKIGIIQLSDIHFEVTNNFVLNCQDSFVKACLSYVKTCQKIIFAISGDIVNTGKKEEYDAMKFFLDYVEKEIKNGSQWINSYIYVLVPGNHDCLFKEDSIRQLVIEKAIVKDEFTDEQMRNTCLSVQENFWSFYEKVKKSIPTNRISYICNVPVDINFSIDFHCYNTSLFSTLSEVTGTLIVPTNDFIQRGDNNKNLVISIFHHNPGWLNTKTPGNNKKLFENHIIKTSNIVISGHEHIKSNVSISDLENNQSTIYLESPAFQYNNTSAFDILTIDSNNGEITKVDFKYSSNEHIYKEINEGSLSIKKKIVGIAINEDFRTSLDKIEMPLSHPNKSSLQLSDIYIYPDLEPLNDLGSKYVKYIDSSMLTEDKALGKIIFIEGDSQSGKSSLIRMTFKAFITKGVYPILLKASEIKHPNCKDQIKRAYKKQYNENIFSFEYYKQLDIDKKVIIIEDIEKSILNSEGKCILFENLIKDFSQVFISTSLQDDIKSIVIASKNESEIQRYHLKSFGYEKRNELIEKWIWLGRDRYTTDPVKIEKDIKLTFDQISNLLGEQYVPSYPVFILSLLQGLNGILKEFNLSQTSYAFCYYSLIIASLKRIEMPVENIEGVIQFISKLAYWLFDKLAIGFTRKEYDEFYNRYSNDYIMSYSKDLMLSNLEKCYIIKFEDDKYTFSYKYIFYYLIALTISQLNDKKKQFELIKNLCYNLYKEKDANILIFLVNQNNINELLDELKFASWLPFEGCQPITLDKTDPIFQQLIQFMDQVKIDVMRNDIDPHQKRIEDLRASDKVHRDREDVNYFQDDDFERNKDLREINNSIKVVRILGQIVKNQRNTFEKSKLVDLVTESYNVTFRTLAFFSKMLQNVESDIINYIKEQNRKNRKLDDDEIVDRVNRLTQSLLYRVCLSNFSNLSISIGAADVMDIFNDVAKQINTPAAKIVSFSINSYYNRLNISELKDIVEEFKNNPVALEIIRSRVMSYVYHNSLTYEERQRIGNICHIRLVNQEGYTKYIKERWNCHKVSQNK